MSHPILHLGLGRFHRAHQAVYFQRLADEFNDQRWTITSFSMRTADARDAMIAVDHRYPVVETEKAETKFRWIDRIREVGALGLDRELFLSRMTDPVLEMVTLTITEKGYCLDVDGRLDLNSAEIKSDLASPEEPKSAIGALAHGLIQRFSDSSPSSRRLTILSCDNLRANGDRLQNAVIAYLEKLGRADVVAILKEHVTFPCSMVDRIVPSLSNDARKKFETEIGLVHPELIATEAFSQWVIEDRFARPRPPLDKVGVDFVKSVRAHEDMKLRLLNAAHSFLAYAGLMRGHSYVHEAAGDPELREWTRRLIFDEAGPLLGTDIDWKSYGERVMKRFENSKLPHSLRQIAMDGSVKIPQRLLPTIEESIRSHASSPACDMAVASWIAFLHREFGPDGGHKVEDPAAQRLKRLWHPEFTKWLKCVATDHQIFGALAGDPTWHERLARAND
ncbi:MAG: mannitol dehydrogenase family protein [Bdellovibrionota bacterium]